jgi:hypothetical protein
VLHVQAYLTPLTSQDVFGLVVSEQVLGTTLPLHLSAEAEFRPIDPQELTVSVHSPTLTLPTTPAETLQQQFFFIGVAVATGAVFLQSQDPVTVLHVQAYLTPLTSQDVFGLVVSEQVLGAGVEAAFTLHEPQTKKPGRFDQFASTQICVPGLPLTTQALDMFLAGQLSPEPVPIGVTVATGVVVLHSQIFFAVLQVQAYFTPLTIQELVGLVVSEQPECAAIFLLSWLSCTIFVATGIAIAINNKAIIKGICANPFLFIMKKVNHYFH